MHPEGLLYLLPTTHIVYNPEVRMEGITQTSKPY